MPKKRTLVRIPLDQLTAAIEEGDSVGFCLLCGEEAYGVEPDARRYTCESCKAPMVYGAEEILLMGQHTD